MTNMKKCSGRIVLFSILVVLSFCNVLNVKAETTEYDAMNSEIFTIEDIDIDEVIRQGFDEADAEWYFSAQFQDDQRAEQCWVSPSIYVVEHVLTNAFVNSPETFDDGVIREQMFNGYPIIYFPFFMNVNGTERVIGHLKLYFNHSKGKYTSTGSFVDYDSIEFQQGEPVHFIEKLVSCENIRNIASQHNINEVQSVFLARHWSAYTDYTDKVVVLEANDGLYVYDFTDAAHVDSTINKPAAMYSYREYTELRKDYEDVALQSVSDFSQVVAGVAVSEKPARNVNKYWTIFMVCFCMFILLIGVIALVMVVIHKRKTH